MAKADTNVAGIKLSVLAKEFNVTSKVLLEIAHGLNIKVANHSSVLTRGQADRLRAKVGGTDAVISKIKKPRRTVRKTAEDPNSKNSSDTAVVEALESGEELDQTDHATESETADIPAENTLEVEANTVTPIVSDEIVKQSMWQAGTEETVNQTQDEQVEVAPEPELPPIRINVPEPSSAIPSFLPRTESKRFLQAGPVIAPPVRKEDSSNQDTRFGVVISADEARKVHGGGKEAPKPAKKPKTAESKPVEDFKAVVSYPKLAGAVSEKDDLKSRDGRRGRPDARRSSSRLRGRNLMDDNDRMRRGPRKRSQIKETPRIVRSGPAEVTSPVTVKNLCEALGIKATELIKKFLQEGQMVTINSILTDSDAELFAAEFDPLKFGIKIKKARDLEEEMIAAHEQPDENSSLKARAPVVTVMGHVDHGKTSLLDKIRSTKIADKEVGGITQHIRAYSISTPRGNITFLDTPGHKAFTEMRARGANITDIVVLVVAADDGVMPQTEEAISHARAAGKTIIVAVNKMDLPSANMERIKGELASKEIFVEGYGGQVGCVAVSALTGQGIPELLERILDECELMELSANPDKRAIGSVVEAHKDPGRGIEATLLVQEGTLHPGDVLVCGHAYGTVRQMVDDLGHPVETAGPSVPVLITGLNDVPLSGERFHSLSDIKTAAEIAEKRAMLLRQEGLTRRQHVSLENVHDLLAQGEVASLKVVLKVDVMGSLRPLESAISELATDEARVQILHSAVGSVNETDIQLADASDAIVIGFGVSVDPGARRLAEERGVQIRSYEIIYEVVTDVRTALEGLLKPIEKEVVQSQIEVRQIFKISRLGSIAGCFVLDGTINRNHHVRLLRDGEKLWSGKLGSLKRVKDDVREVRAGFECGIKLDGFDALKIGDRIESYTVEYISRTLEGTEKK